MDTRNFKFSGNCGDIISIIPAMDKYFRLFNKKIVLYLWLNRKAFYYIGATHPVMDESGNQVMLNQKMFDLIRPLLLAQECIADVKVWQGEEIKIDFDGLYEQNVNKPVGSINRWPFYVFPNLTTALDCIWLNVPNKEHKYTGRIVINRTERYVNQLISYFMLREHQEKCLFVGIKQEHEKFCNDFNLDIEHYEAPDFLELAQVIKQCRFYMGNQSACFQIAEGLKVPRILEICPQFPNVIPIGDYAYDFHYQIGLKSHFDDLLKLTENE